VAGVISLFFLASFFVVIFPCHPPNVWEVLGVRCIDQPAFWEAYTAVNLVIESTLVLFPVLMVYPLTMEKRRKAIVITGFAARLTYVFQTRPNLRETGQTANIKKGHRSFRSTAL
jgi:hypothetical protein